MSPDQKLKYILDNPMKEVICKRTGSTGYVTSSTTATSLIPVQTPQGNTLHVKGKPKIELEVMWMASNSPSRLETVDIDHVKVSYKSLLDTSITNKPHTLDR